MTGSAASSAVLCAASRSDRSAVRCWLASFLAERTARPAPASAATSSQDQGAGQGPAPPPAPGAGPAAGPEELSLGCRQRRVPDRIRGPDARGLPSCGELDPRYSRDGVLAVLAPPRGVLDELTVEDQAGLVLLQPVTQPRPRLQQHVVGDLRGAGAEHHQPAPGERVEHRGGLGPLVLRMARTQLGAGHRTAGRPAVMAHGGHPPEHVPRDRLLVLRQSRRRPPRR